MSVATAISEVIAVSVGGVTVQLSAQSSGRGLSVGGLCVIQDDISQSQTIAVVESTRGRVSSDLETGNADPVRPVAQLTILGQIRNDGPAGQPSFWVRLARRRAPC